MRRVKKTVDGTHLHRRVLVLMQEDGMPPWWAPLVSVRSFEQVSSERVSVCLDRRHPHRRRRRRDSQSLSFRCWDRVEMTCQIPDGAVVTVRIPSRHCVPCSSARSFEPLVDSRWQDVLPVHEWLAAMDRTADLVPDRTGTVLLARNRRETRFGCIRSEREKTYSFLLLEGDQLLIVELVDIICHLWHVFHHRCLVNNRLVTFLLERCAAYSSAFSLDRAGTNLAHTGIRLIG